MWHSKTINFDKVDQRVLNALNTIIKSENPDEQTYFEYLTADLPVKEYDHSKHRWLTYFARVVKIGEYYIEYNWAESHSDDSIFDQDFQFDWQYVRLVEPKVITVIDYVPVE
jgi:hypothetical protein